MRRNFGNRHTNRAMKTAIDGFSFEELSMTMRANTFH
jgi:hypothetical protein